MKSLLFGVFLVVSFSQKSWSEVNLYQLDMTSSIGKQAKIKTTLILREGQFLSYSMGDHHMVEVMAEQDTDNDENIALNFRVSKELGDGSVEVLTEPRILTLPKKTAGIHIGVDSSDELHLEFNAREI